MSKITIAQVKKVLPKIAPGLQKYLCLRCRFHEVNVLKCQQFQTDCNHFFRIRQKSKEFYDEYYRFMEKHKNDESLTFEAVIDHLHRKTGSVEASFASKLLSMINPDKPVLDSRVLATLDIKRVRHSDSKEWIKRNKDTYNAICAWYENHFKSGVAAKWIELFDKRYPDARGRMTDVKKIDLILWQIR